MADIQRYEPQPGIDGPAADLHWYKFFNRTGYDGPFKLDRHFVQWDSRPFDENYTRAVCSLNGEEETACMEARVYCPTCDKYFCLVHHYMIHLVESDNLIAEKTA